MTFQEYATSRGHYDESFRDSFGKSFDASYQQAKQGSEQDYGKYADVAKKALEKAGSAAQLLSKKTGVPLPLATALVAAGITGGPTAVPFAALLYFVKQPLMKGANRAFDATWDAGAKVASAAGRMVGTKPAPQPAMESFRTFIEADTWWDWAGEKLGGLTGRVAGNIAGYGGKIANSLASRAKELTQWTKNNPKEVARMLFLVGAGAAIGAGVGKLTHDIQDFIVQKIKDYGVPKEELDFLRRHVVVNTKVDSHGQAHTGSDDTLLATPGKHYAEPSPDEVTAVKTVDTSTSSDAPNPASRSWFGRTNPNSAQTQTDSQYGFTGLDAPSTGKQAVFSANVEAPSSGAAHTDMGDAYRTMARTMHDSQGGREMMKHLKGLSTDPSYDQELYGHSAAAEIRKRLASPDTYTKPAAIAGGFVGGTGNKRK